MEQTAARSGHLAEARRLVKEAARYARLAEHAAEDCGECWPKNERNLADAAYAQHGQIMAEHRLPFALTLIRGSAIHLPLLRRLVSHYRFPHECEVCKRHHTQFAHILDHVKTKPADIDLVTVGIPQAQAGRFIQLGKQVHKQGGILDISAHLTAEQIRDPRNTYTSYFNIESLKIPPRPGDVNETKMARHFASVTWFLHAYPVFSEHGRKEYDAKRKLRELQLRFQRHLKSLSDAQLEEFNRVMTWRLKKEAYVLFHVGGCKEERARAIARYSAVRNPAGEWDRDFLIHLAELHRYNQNHRMDRRTP